jgi:CheY-like chemotaxis protein
VTSTPGVGSEFVVELPLLPAAAPEGRIALSVPDLRGVRVLAVTPTAACSTLFQVYLGAAGVQVRVVSDLATAHAELQRLAASTQAPLDTLVLLDLDDEDGAEPDSQPWPAGVQVVRLVSRADSQEPVPADQALETRVLARPLLHHDLLHGVAVASGRMRELDPAQTLERRRSPRFKAPSVQEAAQNGRLILVAEDNETNRDVMREQLRLLGYACELGFDGALALQMWQSQPGRYALLLTDCHMPNMDGFELTEAIRAAQGTRTHLPIIAITANAMQGEAQRCLERGMDGYLSKPLRLSELGPMLAKWMPEADTAAEIEPAMENGVPSADAPPHAGDDTLTIWNPATLTDLVGDNPAMHKRLLEKFLANANEQVAAMDAAIAAGNALQAAGVAHTLKSAARSVGALALGELCQAIETAGNDGDAPAWADLARGLAATFAQAEAAINQSITP